MMPLIQVDLRRSVFEEKGKGISDAIHNALVAGFDMETTDLFHVFRPHDEGEIFFSPTYDNRDRRDLIVISITMVNMFSPEQKKKAHKELTKRLVEIGVRRDDILVCMVENNAENWTLGERS
ncbi:MAG: tautomerase family protein [Hespellia sp.]|nr:tautomerase family protein [Hespellia sp.]